ncbi:MAG: ArgE/DapE family deacylase [Rhodobacteraceae bacterium]|nr:ArgE/DapE family deacylase [Paracoccaceae bacterium]
MTLEPSLVRDIIAAVDQGFDDQTGWLQDLVRHPSQRGQEHTAQEMVFNSLTARGYGMDRWAIDIDDIKDHPGFSPVTVDYTNAINVVATHTPTRTIGRSLILNGHIDVVPVGPRDMWARDPYDPQIDGDWMYGRGAGDMKAGLSANIFALDALRRIGFEPGASVYLQSVTEEECTGNGALSCLMRGYRAEAAIIPEPSNHELVRTNVGVIWFRVRVRGHPVHVADAGEGANAIEAAYQIIIRLRQLEAEMNAEKGETRFFADHPHPINLNVGKIAGGDWASSVPAWCDLDLRLSLFPGTEPADIAVRIEAAVGEACRDHPFLSNNPAEVTYNGFFAKGYELPEGTEAEETLIAAHRAVFDEGLTSGPGTAYLDGRVFMLYDDCPALVYGPVSQNIHGFDERVSLTSLRRVTHTIALFIADWCGLNRI